MLFNDEKLKQGIKYQAYRITELQDRYYKLADSHALLLAHLKLRETTATRQLVPSDKLFVFEPSSVGGSGGGGDISKQGAAGKGGHKPIL